MVNVIDYENECMNDNHDPGCLCGAPHFFEALAREKDASKPDPYRPGTPNLLYFKEVVPSTHMDHLTHYWVLTDHKGVRIAEAAGFFRYKLYCLSAFIRFCTFVYICICCNNCYFHIVPPTFICDSHIPLYFNSFVMIMQSYKLYFRHLRMPKNLFHGFPHVPTKKDSHFPFSKILVKM